MMIEQIYQPKTIKEAYDMLINYPDSVVIGGGAWLKFQSPTIKNAIDLSQLGLNNIQISKDFVEIGAMATLFDVENHPEIKALLGGMFSQAVGNILGVGFRNIATIGGSIYGKYAFSDILTPLLCMEVTLNFYRHEPISLIDYLDKKDKIQDILLSILIKKPTGYGFFKKVSNTALDFSMINVAVTRQQHTFNICVGARPGRAKLAVQAAKILNETHILNEKMIENVAQIAVDELQFGSNHLASEAYRKEVAKVYIARGLKEVCQL